MQALNCRILQVNEALLAEIAHRIVAACRPERIILLGSCAYGTLHKASDIDLLVVMNPRNGDETNHQRIMNARAAARIGLLSIDILVRTPEEVKTRLAMGDFFIKEIWERGKVLYHRWRSEDL